MDLTRLTKLSSMPDWAPDGLVEDSREVSVSLRLHEGASRPHYIFWKAQVTGLDYVIKVPATDLSRLDSDPAIETYCLDD